MCSMQACVQLQLNCNRAIVKRTFESVINLRTSIRPGSRMCIDSAGWILWAANLRFIFNGQMVSKSFEMPTNRIKIYVCLFLPIANKIEFSAVEIVLRSGLHFVLGAIKFVRKHLIERHSSIIWLERFYGVLIFVCRCECRNVGNFFTFWNARINGATCRSSWCQCRQHDRAFHVTDSNKTP